MISWILNLSQTLFWGHFHRSQSNDRTDQQTASQFPAFRTETVVKACGAATEIVADVEPVYFNISRIETNTMLHSSLNEKIHWCFFVIEWF
jgi:hypothetical protein